MDKMEKKKYKKERKGKRGKKKNWTFFNCWHTNLIPRNKRKNKGSGGLLQTSKKKCTLIQNTFFLGPVLSLVSHDFMGGFNSSLMGLGIYVGTAKNVCQLLVVLFFSLSLLFFFFFSLCSSFHFFFSFFSFLFLFFFSSFQRAP